MRASKYFRRGVCLFELPCQEANIHYPVDWVLLKDVAQKILKALKPI